MGTTYGALLILSVPPAATTPLYPLATACAPNITAFSPLAHTLFTVVASDSVLIPAPSATCLAGDWPTPAWTTLPRNSSSTSEGSRWDWENACLKATMPSWVAVRDLSVPLMEPTGVREAATMTTSWGPPKWVVL